MHAGEREGGVVVVELAVGPQAGVMTQLAGCRESSGDVVHRAESTVVVSQMASNAGGAGQLVVPVDMTIGALPGRNQVRSGEREPGGGVIECRIGPQHRVVALLASLGEARLCVVGIGRALIILEMATHAGSGREIVVIVHVAIGALPWGHRVGARQGEAG